MRTVVKLYCLHWRIALQITPTPFQLLLEMREITVYKKNKPECTTPLILQLSATFIIISLLDSFPALKSGLFYPTEGISPITAPAEKAGCNQYTGLLFFIHHRAGSNSLIGEIKKPHISTTAF